MRFGWIISEVEKGLGLVSNVLPASLRAAYIHPPANDRQNDHNILTKDVPREGL